MSDNENSSNSDSYDEWEERVVQHNRQLDEIISELLITDLQPRARRRYCDREREQGETLLMEDYFVDNPRYDQATFRRRFRMQRPLFLRIVTAVTAKDEYFQQRPDATGRSGLTPLQKCTGAMRVLAYGTGADAQDEYLRMSETVTREALIQSVEGIISCFGGEYLRRPNEADLAVLLHVGEKRGFPGRSGKPTIILEAVASSDLWIWHAFFGTPGTLNDINVLHRSPVFDDVLAGRAPNAAFVKSITSPQLRKHKLFAERQEGARKDIERAFGVLQARFAFLRHPCLLWDKDAMGKVMNACIIMHNMIVEDERHTYLRYYDPSEFLNDRPTNRQRSTSADDDDDDQNFNTLLNELQTFPVI